MTDVAAQGDVTETVPRPDAVWLVVVNFGSHELVRTNFAPLTAAQADATSPGGPPRVHVVVVDNFSTPAEREAIGDVCRSHGWTLVPMAGNEGFAAGCNAGVRAARDEGARSVVLVNPDAVLGVEVAAELVRQTTERPWDLVAPVVLTSTGQVYFQGIRVDLRTGRMRGRRWPDPDGGSVYLASEPPWRDWLTAACLAFSVALWERAGGLDERYFLYWEDVDFSQRCVEAGARLCLRRDLAVVHDEGATHGDAGSRARSSVYYFYNCRNRLVYAAAHLRRADLLRWVVRTPQESWQILLRGGRRQLLHSPEPLLATVRGSLSGLASVAPALVRPQRRG